MRSINARLGRLVFFGVGTATLIVGSMSAHLEVQRFGESRRDVLEASAGAFAAASADAIARRDEAGTLRALRGLAGLRVVSSANVYLPDGRPFTEMGFSIKKDGDVALVEGGLPDVWSLVSGKTISFERPVLSAGVPVGTIRLYADTEGLSGRLWGVLFDTLGGAAAALAVGFAIALGLQRSITRPLVALTAAMGSIRSGHDYRMAVPVESDDEVGQLAGSFNGMLVEIRDRDARLAAHRDRLEQDVAERTRDLRLAKEEAEGANAAKSDFLATMSHEIRTPMNGMLVMAELLAGSDLPGRERRYAEVIARSGQSLLAIINDILDVSKIESGKLTLEEIAFAPADIVDTVVALFAERASTQSLDLAAFVAPDVPETLHGDPVRVTQILSNLVNNALKFAETGHVLVRVERDGDAVRWSVADTGIGIPADKLGTIFDAFTQADGSTTRRFGGTGLGLSICRRLAEAMGGSIGVESEPGRGSTFSVRLPGTGAAAVAATVPAGLPAVRLDVEGAATGAVLRDGLAAAGFPVDEAGTILVADAGRIAAGRRRPDAARVVALAGLGDPSGTACLRGGFADVVIGRPVSQAEWRTILARLADGGPFDARSGQAAAEPDIRRFAGRRVLVADDTAVNREVACEALARLGIAADAVGDGRAALAAVRARRYDLVLMDGSMPEIDGWEATRLIRRAEAAENLPRTPVLALTAHVVGAAAETWRECGMDGILHKPFTVAKLAAAIDAQLGDAPPVAPEPEAEAAPAAGTAPPAGLLDEGTIDGLLAMAAGGGGPAFVGRLVDLFATNAPATLADLGAASERGDAAAVSAAAHRLKSMGLNLGAARLAEALGAIEAAAQDGAPGDPAAIGALAALLDESLAALRARLVPGAAALAA